MSATDTTDACLYIDGSWAVGGGDAIPVIDPTNESVVQQVPSATRQQVADAVGAAHAARVGWAAHSPRERSAYLRAIARIAGEHSEELAELLVRENGKPLAVARGEVGIVVEYFNYVAEWDRRIEGEILPSDARGEAIHLLRVPYGVVAAILPWNFPLAVFARKVAPALLTGNTVVLKPSEVTPLSVLRLSELVAGNVGLPDGVLNVVTGGGAVGQTLVRDDRVALVTMTGHRATGKQIMRDAADNLTRVSLELGGKAPFIVARGADIDAAVDAAIMGRHLNSGQVCTCAERILVHEGSLAEFTEKYAAAAAALRIGDPMSEVDLGPLVNAAQMAKAEASLAGALDDGATVVVEGGRPAGLEFERGYWFAPAVLTDVTPDMRIMNEETFAPITPIMGFDELESALSIANDSPYGLSAYVFSTDYAEVMRAQHELEVGEIYINRTHGESIQGFHTGHKQSGLGGEDGKHGVLKYTQLRTVYHHHG